MRVCHMSCVRCFAIAKVKCGSCICCEHSFQNCNEQKQKCEINLYSEKKIAQNGDVSRL